MSSTDGMSLVFLMDPSRSETNESTRRNIISQHEKNGDVLLRCFQCNEEVSPLISTKYTHTDQDAAVSIRNFVSSKWIRRRKTEKKLMLCPCCSSVTCPECLSLPALEGTSGSCVYICSHCFSRSSRVKHPVAGRKIATYYTADQKAFRFIWEGFKHFYKKNFSTPVSEETRKNIFQNNLLRIDVLNEDSSSQSVARISAYADLSGNEYIEMARERSRIASELLVLPCHESWTTMLNLKQKLAKLVLQNDFPQFQNCEIDQVIQDIQTLCARSVPQDPYSCSVGGNELEIFCSQSLGIMRKLVPRSIFHVSYNELVKDLSYTNALAHRLLHTKCLWLLSLETADLHQISIRELMGRYAIPSDLDLVESAALLSMLPKTFLNGDVDGDKFSWRNVLTIRVAQLYNQLKQGTLNDALRRHPSYQSVDIPMHCDDHVQPLYTAWSNRTEEYSPEINVRFCCEDYSLMPAKKYDGFKNEYDLMPSLEVTPSKQADSPAKISSHHSPLKIIPSAELSVGELIGRGSFGVVRHGIWRGMAVALKSMRVSDESKGLDSKNNEMCWQDFEKEVKSMSLVCNHANVIQLIGVVQESSSISPCIVTVHYPNGSVYDKIIRPHKRRHHHQVNHSSALLYPDNLTKWALEAARGVSHLHQEGLIHRDLATRNLLLDDVLHVRVCDFGFSRLKNAEASRGMTQSSVGPVRWTSPESMRERSYSTSSDVFSYGVVLYELFTQSEPWAEFDTVEVVLKVCSGERMSVPSHVPVAIKDLMNSCWHDDPTSRPSFENIFSVLFHLDSTNHT